MNKRYHILTLGCQMNISDSQRIASKLESLGYKSASEKEADLVIVNACSVRQHAVDRIWGHFKKWAELEEKQILITGCVLKEDRKKFNGKNVIFFNITDLQNLKNIIDKHSNIHAEDYFDIQPKLDDKNLPAGRQVAYIPIMSGCDNFCSYCAVPYTRGREVSRSQKDIITEIKAALASGHKEILLLGQNVNSYKYDFAKLLKTIDVLPEDFTFNFMSSNPQDMSGDIVNAFAELKKWPRELHLAMQSGDDEILKKMNRKYTANQFSELIGKLKAQMPKLKISTDIIVGFPSETKKQFENTYQICKKIGFYKAYIFKYSPRSGTIAAKLKDDVTSSEKKRRFEKLDHLINKN